MTSFLKHTVITSYSIHYTKLYENLNNVRDLIPDSENDKITLAVLFGEQMAKQYHYALLLLGWVAINIFFVFCFEPGFWLNLLLPGFWAHARFVHHRSGQLLDGGLKQLALFTFAFSRITSYNVCYTKLLR